MISKKRYLELKKRRKQLHNSLWFNKQSYNEAIRFRGVARNALTNSLFKDAQKEYFQNKKEYTLITELINSTKHIMRTDMAFKMANLVNKKLYYRLKHEV